MSSWLSSALGSIGGAILSAVLPVFGNRGGGDGGGNSAPSGISQQDFDRAIEKLRKQHKNDRVEWDKERKKAETVAETRYKKHESEQYTRYQKEMSTREKEIENMNLLNQLSERLKDEKHDISLITQLKTQRNIYIESGQPIRVTLNQLKQEYSELAAKIAVESELISKFSSERHDPSCQLVVTLGSTGVGKSTFCNRCIGDTSDEGNQYTFGVAKDFNFDSHTSYIAKQTITLSNSMNALHKITFVDTPGAQDTKGCDFQHSNNLAEYLRGSGGVNAFLVFFTCAEPRLTQWYKNLLLEYQELLGKNFWNNVIIVATKGGSLNDQQIPSFKRQLSQKLKAELKLNVDLPVVVTSHKYYKRSLKELFSMIPKRKYNCEAIVSPIDKLRTNESQLRRERNAMEQKLQTIYSKCGEIDGQIKSINISLNQNDSQIRNLQMLLDKPVRNQIEYESNDLPSLIENLGVQMDDDIKENENVYGNINVNDHNYNNSNANYDNYNNVIDNSEFVGGFGAMPDGFEEGKSNFDWNTNGSGTSGTPSRTYNQNDTTHLSNEANYFGTTGQSPNDGSAFSDPSMRAAMSMSDEELTRMLQSGQF